MSLEISYYMILWSAKSLPNHFVWEFSPVMFRSNILWDPRSGMTPKWGFGVAMLAVGALCFYQVHFGRTVLPKWLLWAHLFYSVFYSVSELRRACIRQARVARAVLPPSILFRARAFSLPPCAPRSHICPLPHLGVSGHHRIKSNNYRGTSTAALCS